MMLQKGIAYGLLLCLSFGGAYSAGGGPELEHIRVDVRDQAALQRGAAMYMNYCSGCHSLKYMRYNRMAKDMGLTHFTGELDTELLVNNLIFTDAKPHAPIEISMPAESARQWFGVVPPDLSLSAREKGVSWIYSYLKGFYADESRPFGSNNVFVPGVAMPNVLAPLSGRVIDTSDGHPSLDSLLLVQKGTMSEHRFDSALQDLVTFLAYVGEPAQLSRYRIGAGVMVFLLVFLLLSWQLKKLYWRQIKK